MIRIRSWGRPKPARRPDDTALQDDLERRSIEAAQNLRHTASNAEQIIEALLAERQRHRRGVIAP